ncbi:uncharacterized protein EI90DRAFT_3027778 [Cantharellus anzutake]|uniref:uncharacterized protein n=1 Tax=Cantharellus anzutake TaxID=1750568 RepID=UPI001905353B|nr:uncharacterized protein EI90DRAFT_3027778 [Cantharellus anzutake]KAF8343983.1 hypothetical protein EI90DRAFT_3027778 [Cantharellus anzutake]
MSCEEPLIAALLLLSAPYNGSASRRIDLDPYDKAFSCVTTEACSNPNPVVGHRVRRVATNNFLAEQQRVQL